MRCAFLGLVAALVFSSPALAQQQEIIGETDGSDVVTVRNPGETGSKQDLPYFPGISGETAGAEQMSMQKVVIPPGAAAKAHIHKGYESTIYLIKGRVETRYGEGLRESVVNVAGDFIFIPPGVPHQPRNLSTEEEAVAVVARSHPDEQEDVVLYPEGEEAK